MSRFIIIIAIVLAIGGGLAYVFINRTNKPAQLAPDTKIYDVRTLPEYQAGHTKGAILLPLADIESGKMPTEDKTAAIAVYCRSGNRSSQATALLKKTGFTNVKDLGGLTNLTTYNLPIVR